MARPDDRGSTAHNAGGRDLGRVGVRSHRIGNGDLKQATVALRELEDLGFGTVWISAAAMLERGPALAAATERIIIASSVGSIWVYEPDEIAAAFAVLQDAHPGRFLLGIGASHGPVVERMAPGRTYAKPVSSMLAWLDAVESAPVPISPGQRIIAAIWPRMLGVARDRAAGSHPYLVPVSHTREARGILGEGPVLAPAHVCWLGTDPVRAREIGRRHINNPYLTLPNYRNNWLRHGMEPGDVENGGSDRLVDALVAWGDPDTVAAKLSEHHAAGADHVAVQVLSDDGATFPREQWRLLAAALGASRAPIPRLI
jgi:probable F420-dependent oxidoreductase